MQPQPPASPESLQPQFQAPPPGSNKKIWISVLVPLGTLLLFLIYIVIDEKSDSNRMNGSIFQAMLWMQALVTIACWIVFCTAANERLRGNTKVILIVFYPIVQVGLQCVIFFCGCLALFSLA